MKHAPQTASSRTPGRRTAWLAGLALAAAWLLGAPQVVPQDVPESVGTEPGETEPSSLVKSSDTSQWGIELVSLRVTANGHMLDFRYRVLDVEQAGALFDRATKPYLVHQASGKTLAVPVTAKVGPLRNSNVPQKGRIYWMFFGNPGYLVKAGDLVTVEIGDFRVENLAVE